MYFLMMNGLHDKLPNVAPLIQRGVVTDTNTGLNQSNE
jgi:hypothetical protein